MRSRTESSQFLRIFLPTFAYVRVEARDNISQISGEIILILS